MAIIQGKYLRGSIGNYAFRKVGDRNIVQSKPERGSVRQTEATKESGAEFGLASTAGKMVRHAFGNLYGHDHDGRMMNRMVKTLTEVLQNDPVRPRGQREIASGDISRLQGFEFNQQAALHARWKVRPEVKMDEKGTVTISIPAFDIIRDLKYPGSDCSRFIIRAMVIAFDFKNKRYKELSTESLEVRVNVGQQQAVEWQFEADVPEGCLLLAGLSLKYYQKKYGIMEPVEDASKCNATEIIGAFVRPDREVPYQEPQRYIRLSKYASKSVDTGWHTAGFNSKAYDKLKNQLLKAEEKQQQLESENRQRQTEAAKQERATTAGKKPDKDGWIEV